MMKNVINDDRPALDAKSKQLNGKLSIRRSAIFILLKNLANENEEFFNVKNVPSSYANRFATCFQKISMSVPQIEGVVNKLQEIAPRYDYDKATPGNGYRSLVCICDMVVLHLISVLRSCTEQRNTLMFRASHFCKEIESFCAVLDFLVPALQQVLDFSKMAPPASLFPDLNANFEQYYTLLNGIQLLDSSCFYGRPLGFQFPTTVGRIFRFIGVILATYSLSKEKGHGPIGSLINSGRFILSPEQRASRIIKVTREADVQFCRSFWNLGEFGNQMPKLFCPNMAVNELREITWHGPITMDTTDKDFVHIPEPSSHTGVRPVKIRVLSYVQRAFLGSNGSQNQLSASPYLLLHCHGGGYVATSSKSHETYLRVWAKILNCCIVSVEYSLAPENPFPRPTEEVLYAYAYIIKNPSEFGWTGEKICLVGDSAGGNLIMSVCLQLLKLRVKRMPNGIVPIYTPFLFQYIPSPSRLLSFMDPLIHAGVVARCVSAYTGGISQRDAENSNSDKGTNSTHKSLQEYVDQVQKAQKNKELDFGDSSSIVSLINLSNNSEIDGHQFPVHSSSELNIRNDDNSNSANCNDGDENDNDEDEGHRSGIQINSDPLNIHLSSNMYDRRLATFLQAHPITKSSVFIDCNGCTNSVPPMEENGKMHANTLKKSISRSSRIASILCSPLASNPKESIATSDPSIDALMVASHSSHTIAPKYDSIANKRSLSQSLADTAAMAAGHALDNISDWLEKSRPAVQTVKPKLNRAASLKSDILGDDEKTSDAIDESIHVQQKVYRDPLISPMYAKPEVLRKLPPMWFVACHLDPLLDDTITFAKKMRDAGGRVMSVDLLDNLPHGFLNFTIVSPECREGSKICLIRIKEAFGMPL